MKKKNRKSYNKKSKNESKLIQTLISDFFKQASNECVQLIEEAKTIRFMWSFSMGIAIAQIDPLVDKY